MTNKLFFDEDLSMSCNMAVRIFRAFGNSRPDIDFLGWA